MHKEAADAERSLLKLQALRTLDSGATPALLDTLEHVAEPLQLLFEAYATSMYEQPHEGDEQEPPPS